MSDQDGKFNHQDGVSLKEHFNSRIAALEKQLETHKETTDEAVTRAREVYQEAITRERETNQHRFSVLNDHKANMDSLSANMRSRQECEALHERSTEDITALKTFRANLEGKASQSSVTVATIIGGAGAICGGLALILEIIDFFRR